jgi:hypothetical protein
MKEAQDDLRILRMWAAGQRDKGRIHGEVYNPAEKKELPGVLVYLRDANQSYSTTTDSRGQFLFTNLDPGIYEVATELSNWGAPMKIDLVRAWCSSHVVLRPE